MPDSNSIAELEKAAQALREALEFSRQVAGDDIKFKIARDACIQRFEYCVELAWKVSMRKLGSQTKFAKPAVREMARGDLVDHADVWLGFIEARNESSHSYDENVARKVFAEILKFEIAVEDLMSRLRKLS